MSVGKMSDHRSKRQSRSFYRCPLNCYHSNPLAKVNSSLKLQNNMQIHTVYAHDIPTYVEMSSDTNSYLMSHAH